MKKQNTYQKYCPNVYVAKCSDRQERGSVITLTTRRGKENNHYVHNLVGRSSDGDYYYSITREDGYNLQERAKKKAERYESWSESRERKSNEYYEASKEGRDFLSLGEPIKVGHHSEKRHRALIERNWNRMGKSVENREKAEEHLEKAEYWKSKENEINLSMPESLEYYEYKLEEAKELHEGIKSGKYEKQHSYSLTYAKKSVNDLNKKVKLANILWGN